MEPGLIDRDHPVMRPRWRRVYLKPQWSPVLSTGITRRSIGKGVEADVAAMEPGLIDRDHVRVDPRYGGSQ